MSEIMTEDQIKKAMEDMKKREKQLLEDATTIAAMRTRLAEDSKTIRRIVEESITKQAVGKVFKSFLNTADGKRNGTRWFLAQRAKGTYLEGIAVEIKTNDLQSGVHLPNYSDATIPVTEKQEDIPAEVAAMLEYIKKK